MKTVTILIGNSDNKLTQDEWSSYVQECQENIAIYSEEIFFFGAPPNYSPWQNACWCIGLEDVSLRHLTKILTKIRKDFKQDSIAITIGKTTFI